MIPGGQIATCFMEAWWVTREGFIALAPNDMNGQSFFVTRAGTAVAQLDDLEAGNPVRIMAPRGVFHRPDINIARKRIVAGIFGT
jgi:hypothetical protein